MIVAQGNRIALRPATPADRDRAFGWLAALRAASGPQGSGWREAILPDLDAFHAAWPLAWFDGSGSFDGRAYVVLDDEREIGFLSHGPVNLLVDAVELVLWLAAPQLGGRGYGSEALALACAWLQGSHGVNRFVVRPSRRNLRALRAMRRAGFREVDVDPHEAARRLELPPAAHPDPLVMLHARPMPAPRLLPDPGCRHVFVDSEFTRLVRPSLMSVGAVSEDGAAFYVELDDWPPGDCSQFVTRYVLPHFEGGAVPRAVAADRFGAWLRSFDRPVVLVSDSGFDRWALQALLQSDRLPDRVGWRRVPVAYEDTDAACERLDLRRHHALDDARALRHLLSGPAD